MAPLRRSTAAKHGQQGLRLIIMSIIMRIIWFPDNILARIMEQLVGAYLAEGLNSVTAIVHSVQDIEKLAKYVPDLRPTV